MYDLLYTIVKGLNRSSLPSSRSLAALLGVSHATVARAVAKLRHAGIVSGERIIRIQAAQGLQAVSPDRPRSGDKLYHELIRGIRSGTFRAGMPLPKVGFFTIKNRVSRVTVLRVYGRLIREGAVHQAGRRFIVGHRIGPEAATRTGTGPVIVLLCNLPKTWKGLCRGLVTSEFCNSLLNEARDRGVKVLELSTGYDSATMNGEPMGAAKDRIRRTIHGLDSHYAGTIVVGKRDQYPEFETWLRDLVGHGRPVVWLDRAGEETTISDKLLYRCVHSEIDIVREVCLALGRTRHRTVLFPVRPTIPWHTERFRLIRRVAGSLPDPIQVVSSVLIEPGQWAEAAANGLQARLCELVSRSSGRLRNILRVFASRNRELAVQYGGRTPSESGDSRFEGLAAFLARGCPRGTDDERKLATMADVVWFVLNLLPPPISAPVTAIISPNDRFVKSYLSHWLSALGLVAGRHLSVVSIDNENRFDMPSVSSVDLGYGRLGYQAFHAVMGDVPIDANRRNVIVARPALVDRGTIIEPRESLQELLCR